MIILFGKNKLDVIFLARWSPDDIIASPFPLNRLQNRAKVFMRKYLNSYPPIISRDFFLLKPQVYSRVHKSSDSFFSKILEKPSIVQKKIIPHRNGLHFSMK